MDDRLRRRSRVSAHGDAGEDDLQPAPRQDASGVSLTVPPAPSQLGGSNAHQSNENEISKTVREPAPSEVSRNSFDHAHDKYFERRDSIYDDRNTIVERHLVARDILALVFNKMVGTGIFVAPALTLALTQSPTVSISMWVAGGIYTALSLLVYLEFGTRFPFNGGELIYLDRIYKPGFLFTIFFAGYNLCFGNTTGNAIQFGQYVALSALDRKIITSDDPEEALDYRVVKLIAWVALTLACGVLFLLPRIGMFLNKILALFKICLLIVVFAKGFQHSYGPDSGHADMARKGDPSFINNMSAMVYVIYSYTGWENGNYVAGEIRELSEKKAASKLLKGSMSAVLITTVLYVLVVTAYYLSTSFDAIVQDKRFLGLGEDFAPKVFGGNGRALNVLVAISAFGNLIAVVYTSAKIKQAIARQRFIPFWNYIEMGRSSVANVPSGGLFLHWVTTSIWIITLPIDKDGYNFVIGISTYGRIMIETAVFIGLLVLYWRRRKTGKGDFLVLRLTSLQTILPLALIAFNGMILVVSAMDVKGLAIPRYWWPAAIGIVFASSLIYWAVIKLLQAPTTIFKRKAQTVPQTGHEMHSRDGSQVALTALSTDRRIIAQFFGFRTFEVYQWTDMRDEQRWPVRMKVSMEEALADGSRRRLDTQLQEPPQRISQLAASSRGWISRHLF